MYLLHHPAPASPLSNPHSPLPQAPSNAASPLPRFHKKSARISELLEESTLQRKLSAFDSGSVQSIPQAGDASELQKSHLSPLPPQQSTLPLYPRPGSSLGTGLGRVTSPGGISELAGSVGEPSVTDMEAASGKHHWRKLNKAVVATKVLVGQFGGSRERGKDLDK